MPKSVETKVSLFSVVGSDLSSASSSPVKPMTPSCVPLRSELSRFRESSVMLKIEFLFSLLVRASSFERRSLLEMGLGPTEEFKISSASSGVRSRSESLGCWLIRGLFLG